MISRSLSQLLLLFHWLLFRTVSACTSQATTPTPACATCRADMLTLTLGIPGQSTTPTLSRITTTADGCEHVTVTCTAINSGIIFMQFNVNQGGPINPTGSQVNAQLDCVNGQWVYQQGTQSRVVSEVNCVSA